MIMALALVANAERSDRHQLVELLQSRYWEL